MCSIRVYDVFAINLVYANKSQANLTDKNCILSCHQHFVAQLKYNQPLCLIFLLHNGYFIYLCHCSNNAYICRVMLLGSRHAGRTQNYSVVRLAALESRAMKRANLMTILYLPIIFLAYGLILGKDCTMITCFCVNYHD